MRIHLQRLRLIATKVTLLALLLSVISVVSFIAPSLSQRANAATVTASGDHASPAICDQTVSNPESVDAYRLIGGDCVVEFKRVGTTTWTVPAGVVSVRYLLVGGGGSGTRGICAVYWGQGGGGGEVLSGTISLFSAVSETVVVGAGGGRTGDCNSGSNQGNDGTSTSFKGLTARPGKSGINSSTSNVGRYGGTSGNGNAGGEGTANGSNCNGLSLCGTGGGGGAGGAGNVKDGGAGVIDSITGSSRGYGGGGAGRDSNSYGSVTSDHGGAPIGDAPANRGGGGADSSPNTFGGAGGSGIVVIRYNPDSTSPTLSAVAVTSTGTSLTLTYDETLAATVPATTRFVVNDSGTVRSVNSASVSGSTITLSLATAITVGRVVTLSYDTATSIAGALTEDLAGNDAAAFSNTAVTNNSTALNALTTPTSLSVTSTDTSIATFSYTPTTNASSHTLRLYDSATATLLTTQTSFASGSALSSLTPATQYYATLQAVGDGTTFESSSVSSPVYFTTSIRAPLITVQPLDTSTTSTRNAYFSITATSPDAGTLFYQWQRSSDGGAAFADLSNGSGISGATTSTLTLTSISTSASGDRFRVFVTNAKNGVSASETSSTVTLTVNSALALTGGSNISKSFGTTANSSALSASGGTGTVTFTISGATTGVTIDASTGVVTSAANTPRGTYSLTITATDQVGATATQGVTITVGVGIPLVTLTLSSSPAKGKILTITATVSVSGTVRFVEKGRVIPGCKAKEVTSSEAICTWRPRIHGPLEVKVILTPSTADYASITTRQNFFVARRMGTS